MTRDLTIVIPAFNAAEYLAQAIASARAQQGVTTQVIVVDDGSRDRTAEIAAAVPEVQLIRQENAGVSAARNAGLALAEAPFVWFLDADDLMLPDAAATSIAAFAARPGSPLVFGSLVEIDALGQPIREMRLAEEVVSMERLLRGAIPRPSQTLFRADAVRQAGGFRAGLAMCEDFELYLRMLDAERPAFCHGHPVASYRRHEGQVTNRAAAMMGASLDVVRAAATSRPELQIDLPALERHWKRRLGGMIPFEILRNLREGRIAAAASALSSFIGAMPDSLIGSFEAFRKRL